MCSECAWHPVHANAVVCNCGFYESLAQVRPSFTGLFIRPSMLSPAVYKGPGHVCGHQPQRPSSSLKPCSEEHAWYLLGLLHWQVRPSGGEGSRGSPVGKTQTLLQGGVGGGSPLWGAWGVSHHVTSKCVAVKKTALLVHVAAGTRGFSIWASH